MDSKQIRSKFIQFFVNLQHYNYPAVPIVDHSDPSLLFINAGMNPFKAFILNHKPVTWPRVCSVQPCLRVSGKHNDLEEVGVDTYHHTLFEMLGNWSFGDYFKQDAIEWAWQLLTEVYNLPKDQLYVTVFGGDQKDNLSKDYGAENIWANVLPKDHILCCEKAHNFWEMGEQGPCGPCSEIHIDLRSKQERLTIPAVQLINKGHPQVIEVWNLVFMQYNRLLEGTLETLPNRHIDTGMGLERLAMIMQHKKSNYDTDIFQPLLEKLADLSHKSYQQNFTIATAMRVIVDHIRALVFSIADGEQPSNTKRGYVIRRILRRAMRYGYSYLNLQEPFMYQLVDVLAQQLKEVYPKIYLQQAHIRQVILSEEKLFLNTLDSGLYLFEQTIKKSQGTIDGKTAFRLYDTHGFPLDLILLLAKEQGVMVDEVGFQQELQAQKLRSKQDATTKQGDWQVVYKDKAHHFVGYDHQSIMSYVVQWRTIINKHGQVYQVVLEQTPFYPEGGGQCADVGILLTAHESIEVLDVQKENGLILHTIGQLPTDIMEPLEAKVDLDKRLATTINHSATHLLHAALKTILGNRVMQKGSLIRSDILRFDFTYHTKVSSDQLDAIESLVNVKIRDNIPCLDERSVPLKKAQAMGAQALFTEKYGDKVRVITFDPAFSIELCGGTHVASTGQIGLFKIIKETAVGTGIRRIEAVTAYHAEAFIREQMALLMKITGLLKFPKNLIQSLEALIEEKKQLEKQLKIYQLKATAQLVAQLQGKLESYQGTYLLVQQVQVDHLDRLKQVALQYQTLYKKIGIIIAAQVKHQVQLVVCISDGLLACIHKDAQALVKCLSPCIGGKGGGKPGFALAIGSKSEGIAKALNLAKQMIIKDLDCKT